MRLNALAVLRRLGLVEAGHSLTEWRGKCPFHLSDSKRSRSLAVGLQCRKFFCHKCHQTGDLIDLWAHVRGVSPAEAVRQLREEFQ